MKTIDGGSFKMGWRAAEPEAFAGVPVTVDSFAIDAFEVSVARFRKFWSSGHPAAGAVVYPDGQVVEPLDEPSEPASDDQAYNWSSMPGERENFPINRLSWATAQAFCVWDGGRLPTEAEWEYVATGREVPGLTPGRTYPWGEEDPTCLLANSIECQLPTTVAIDALRAFGGVYQMAGNVTEWTADDYEDFGGSCWDGSARKNPLCHHDSSGPWVAKGGSFVATYHQLQGTWRLAGKVSGARGVRCARELIGD